MSYTKSQTNTGFNIIPGEDIATALAARRKTIELARSYISRGVEMPNHN